MITPLTFEDIYIKLNHAIEEGDKEKIDYWYNLFEHANNAQRMFAMEEHLYNLRIKLQKIKTTREQRKDPDITLTELNLLEQIRVTEEMLVNFYKYK